MKFETPKMEIMVDLLDDVRLLEESSGSLVEGPGSNIDDLT